MPAHTLVKYAQRPHSIYPLVTLRIAFGVLMFSSTLRFMLKGWVHDLYVEPTFFFTYYGLGFVQPVGGWMYFIFFLMLVASVCITLGAWFRVSSVLFFLLFTYVELIDKTNYLNHYYMVSLTAGMLMLSSAHRCFSVDAWRTPTLETKVVQGWQIDIFKLQFTLIYLFAGIAKINHWWLIEAMPLKLWLPALAHLPIIGGLLSMVETAYAFSWFGMVYDVSIGFLLLYHRTRLWAYVAVIVFHVLTSILFPIGVFPYVMICCTLIFFSSGFHHKLLLMINRLWQKMIPTSHDFLSERRTNSTPSIQTGISFLKTKWVLCGLYFLVQIVLPFRYMMYPGELFWTEQGYRFSWRVMLMEKAGHTTFTITDGRDSSRREWVDNSHHLTPQQEKMMSTQPDMILQYAHYLANVYTEKGFDQPIVQCQSYVTLNGMRSREFVDPNVNLATQKRGYTHKEWVLLYED